MVANRWSLRECYRNAEYRRFRVQDNRGRWYDVLGFDPTGDSMLGWCDGQMSAHLLAPDEQVWSRFTTYV